MASSWLTSEARRIVVQARALWKESSEPLFLHWQRGRLQASREMHLDGFQRVTRMNLPMDKIDLGLTEWITWELRNVPCHPER